MAHVQISNIDPLISYDVGTSPRSVFPVPFAYFAATELVVTVGGVALVSSDYTVSGTAVDSGFSSGSVTLDTAVTSVTVTIERILPIERVTDFPNSGPLDIPALNTQFDKLVAICQQLDVGQSTFLSDVAASRALFETLINADTTVTLFSTRATIALANVDAGTGYIRTAGYASVGDGGHALYQRKGSQPSHPGKVQTLNGVWFELVESSPNGFQFGMVGDGTTDNYLAYTDLVAFAKAKGTDHYVRAGHYVLNYSGSRPSIFINRTSLIGDGIGFFPPSATALDGTWFFITGTSASPLMIGDTDVLLEGGRAAVRHIQFLWPEQLNPTAPVAYPAAILLAHGSTIAEISYCTFINPTTAISISDVAGGNGDVHIHNCYFSAFSSCINIAATAFNNWIYKNEFHWSMGYNFYQTGSTFNPAWPSGQGAAWTAYAQAHTIGIYFSASHADAQIIEGNLFGGLGYGVLASVNTDETFLWADFNGNHFDGCIFGIAFANKFRPSQVNIRGGSMQGVPSNGSSVALQVALNGTGQYSLIVSDVQFGATGGSQMTISSSNGQNGDVQVNGCRMIQPGNSAANIFTSGDSIDVTATGNVFDGGGATATLGVEFSTVRAFTLTGNTFKSHAFGIKTDTTAATGTAVGNNTVSVTTAEAVSVTNKHFTGNSW